jgi:hypothetical protein
MRDQLPTFGDNVRIRTTSVTKTLGLAGLIGQIYGETKPFVGALILAYEAIGAAFTWMVGRAWAGVPASTDLDESTDRTT